MRDSHGFTLLELLLIAVIVGILAGLSIPAYSSFPVRGFDVRVASTVRGVATSEEAYYATHRIYAGNVSDLRDVVFDGVVITVGPGNSGDLATSFRVTGTHPKAARRYTWLSDPKPGERNLIEN